MQRASQLSQGADRVLRSGMGCNALWPERTAAALTETLDSRSLQQSSTMKVICGSCNGPLSTTAIS